MISSIHIKNFKTLKDTGKVPIKPLTLLTGVNGTGKSSLIQVLLLLRQSYEKGILAREKKIILKGNLVDIGTGRDALYSFANEYDHIEFTTEFKSHYSSYISDSESIKLKYEPDDSILEPYYEYPLHQLIDDDSDDSTDENNNLSGAEIEDRALEAYEKEERIHSAREDFFYNPQALFNKNFQYLKAMHTDPQETYKEGIINEDNPLGLKGEKTIHYLNHHANRKEITFDNLHHPNAKSRGLVHEVDAWLGEISPNVRLKTTKIPGSELIIAGYEFGTRNDYTDAFKPKNVGFGISYVLPVITAILSAEPGRLIIIENPEAHLHPRGQARMGHLMALAAQNDVQLIIETHSDHILNGIRVAIKKEETNADRVSLLYFQREIENREHRAKIIIPKIDQDGRIDKWPDGFFDEWEKMLDELI